MTSSAHRFRAAAIILSMALAACSTSADLMASGPLTAVCPDPVVFQTDWYPEAEDGALYHLADDKSFEVDGETGTVRARMVAQEIDMGVDIEIRSGGEPIDFRTVASELHHEHDILMGIVVTDQAMVAHSVHPTIAVVSLLDRDPMMIMWDPHHHDVHELAALPDHVPVSVFGPAPYLDHLVDAGILAAAQIEPTHMGTPDRFVALDGTIAQQGYASTDPYLYEHSTKGWNRPIRHQLIHDMGWEVYGGALAMRPDAIEQWAPCLELLVPVIQQAVIDYVENPGPANRRLARAAAPFDPVWEYPEHLGNEAVAQQIELNLVGNGPDATVGNFDLDRVAALVDRAREVTHFDSDFTADDLVTNRFIDPSIGFQG